MSNTQITIDLLNIAGFKLHHQEAHHVIFVKDIDKTSFLQVAFPTSGLSLGVALVERYEGSNDIRADEMTMELLSGIYYAYAGKPLEWDIKKIWRKELEAMGFAGTDDNNSYQRMFKVGKKADFNFYITEDEDKRFMYEAKLPGVYQEDCEIAGINTPDHVRKFLDAVGEL